MAKIVNISDFQPAAPSGALGLSVRVGHNQHKDVLAAIVAGADDFNGIIVEATKGHVQRDLRGEVLQRGLDVALDPMTPQLAYEHRLSKSLEELPWAGETHHQPRDFQGDAGMAKVDALYEAAKSGGYTQVLAHTHIIEDPNSPWLRHDVDNANRLYRAIQSDRSRMQMVYPLVLPMSVLKDPVRMNAVVGALSNASFDILQLRIVNFEWNATGVKTRDYVLAARQLRVLGVPIVGDMVGGLSGLTLMAFGAVGGISHGITLAQSLTISSWSRARGKSSGGQPIRVYLPGLDMCVKPAEAEQYFSSRSLKRKHTCRDTQCCPGGRPDMLDNPTRHFLRQRSGEVKRIGRMPEAIRGAEFVESFVRPVSDQLATAVTEDFGSERLLARLQKQNKRMARFRDVISNMVAQDEIEGRALSPARREDRQA